MAGTGGADAIVPFVGLTGGLGSGKSTALAALAALGADTISSDAVVHELYDEPAVRDAVVERFGPEVAPGGAVDRSLLAERAFATGEDRAWLEQLIWPLVGARVSDWLASARTRTPPPAAAIVEVPLLFEAGLQDAYDATIAVIADESTRAQRAAARGHAVVDERAARQLSQEEKAARATYVVRNDGSVEQLARELSGVLAKLAG
jgi:dephospho-CoA kinase